MSFSLVLHLGGFSSINKLRRNFFDLFPLSKDIWDRLDVNLQKFVQKIRQDFSCLKKVTCGHSDHKLKYNIINTLKSLILLLLQKNGASAT